MDEHPSSLGVTVMSLLCTRGTKGRLKASGVEFEIVDTTEDTCTLKMRGVRETVVVKDSELRELADQIKGPLSAGSWSSFVMWERRPR
jgi:hypothetical protein